MKKIIIAFNGGHFSPAGFEFARKINELQPVLLTGVFMTEASYTSLWSYTAGMAGPSYIPLIEEIPDVVENSISHFEDMCVRNGISYRVHNDQGKFAIPELKKETRFADLLIIGSDAFFQSQVGVNPIDYLKEALHEAECPVMVIPDKYEFPECNILAYDGSRDCVFAIKQFVYLFPELCGNKTVLVFSRNDTHDRLPDEIYIEELASQHFTDLELLKLDIDPKKDFTKWLRANKNAVLVSGSFGRSAISQFLKRSFAEGIIEERHIPVFIAHL
jgi:hypothetical protein